MLNLFANISQSFSLVDSHKELGDYLALITILIIAIVVLSFLLYASYRGGMVLADSVVKQEDEICLMKLRIELYNIANEQAKQNFESQQKIIADLRQQLLRERREIDGS